MCPLQVELKESAEEGDVEQGRSGWKGGGRDPQQCLLPSGAIHGELLGLVPACLSVPVGSLDKTGAAYLKAGRRGCGVGEAGPWSWHMWPWYLTCLISSDTTAGFCGHTPE